MESFQFSQNYRLGPELRTEHTEYIPNAGATGSWGRPPPMRLVGRCPLRTSLLRRSAATLTLVGGGLR